MAMLMVGSNQTPVILLDWLDIDTNNRHFFIHASVAIEGFTHTLSLVEGAYDQRKGEALHPQGFHEETQDHVGSYMQTDCCQ
jgi:hypothetical protein